MSAVVTFQKVHNVASNRILVGEFGGHRMSAGLEMYFQNLMSIFSKEAWHFAFYAFREDSWDGMDYELGDKKLPWSYWKALGAGQKPQLARKGTYFCVFGNQKGFARIKLTSILKSPINTFSSKGGKHHICLTQALNEGA